jgi:hypothetical protein
MTNIFSRKPLPSVPSRRYTLWIDLFEQKVAEAQKNIQQLTSMERPYNLTKEFFELKALPNDVKIDVLSSYISVNIQALPSNSSEDIRKFRDEFEAFLTKNKFLDPKIGIGENIAGLWKDWDNRFYSSGALTHICTSWKIPDSGLADMALRVERKEVVSYDTRYTLVPRNPTNSVITEKGWGPIPPEPKEWPERMSATEVREMKTFREMYQGSFRIDDGKDSF